MKYIIKILLFACAVLFVAGIVLYAIDHPYQHKVLGSFTLLLFFVLMPLFLFSRRNKSKLVDKLREEHEKYRKPK